MAVTGGAERTLYAHWTDRQTVTFKPNGGTCGTDSMECGVGEPYPALSTPVREGYEFTGWFTAKEGGSPVAAGDAVTAAATRTLHAHWEELPRQTVTFDANGGTCAKTSATYLLGGVYSGFKMASRENHEFRGWYDAPEGGKRVKNGMTVTGGAERTLYAHWEATASPLSISGFAATGSVGPAGRDAGKASREWAIRFEAIADVVYEVQWAPAPEGEWSVLKRWVADADGETLVRVSVPAGSGGGFLRILAPAGE